MADDGGKNVTSPLLGMLGKRNLKDWATKEQVGEQDPRYQAKLEEYKNFQAHNLVDSALVAANATGLNVLAQRKLFGNKQSYKVILASKLIGAAATMSVMLGLRSSMPDATSKLDEELDHRYFSRITRFLKKQVGIEQNEPPKAEDKKLESGVNIPVTLAAAVGTGIAAQYYLGEEHAPLRNVALGAAAASTALVITAGTIAPETTATLQEEFDRRYLKPAGTYVKKMLGLHSSAENSEPKQNAPIPLYAPLIKRALDENKKEAFLTKLAIKAQAEGLNTMDSSQSQAWFEQGKAICNALKNSFAADQHGARSFAAIFMRKAEQLAPEYFSPAISAACTQSILTNRRNDLQAMETLLDDSGFRNQILSLASTAPGSLKMPVRNNTEKLVHSLLLDGEPAVHIFGTAYGQKIVHQILVECFKENGELQKQLAESLSAQLSSVDAVQCELWHTPTSASAGWRLRKLRAPWRQMRQRHSKRLSGAKKCAQN